MRNISRILENILVCIVFSLLLVGYAYAQIVYPNPMYYLSDFSSSGSPLSPYMFNSWMSSPFMSYGLSTSFSQYVPVTTDNFSFNNYLSQTNLSISPFNNQTMYNSLNPMLPYSSGFSRPLFGPILSTGLGGTNLPFMQYSIMPGFGFNFIGSMYYPFMSFPFLQSAPSTSQQPQPTQVESSRLRTEAIDLSNVQSDNRFIENYFLSAFDIPLEVSQYTLPLSFESISNYDDFISKVRLSNTALNKLRENGFVVIDNPFNYQEEDIIHPYKTIKDRELPVFITSDSLLHLYHIQFDETLRQIEEKEFYDKIWKISIALYNDSMEKYNTLTGDLKEAVKRNIAYLSVGLNLLKPKQEQLCENIYSDPWWNCQDPGLASAAFNTDDLAHYSFTIPTIVKSVVEQEIALIEAHNGFAPSPIFLYKEDYSQYIPRGHYTRSERLKNYFKACMWYGRISMLLKGSSTIFAGNTDSFNSEGLISAYDAMIQTMQACLITCAFAEDQTIKDKWDRIYSVTGFYVGLSDDLGPYQYLEALNSVFDGAIDINELNDETIGEVKAKLAEYMPPKIFGGTGDCGITPPFTIEQADQCLDKTKGFRFMGQRFIPDSYMFSNLVGAYTDIYTGDKSCNDVFTCVISGAGRRIRGFPRGLDIMALLGSQRAKYLLKELDDENYKNYEEQFKKLEDEFSQLEVEEWVQNLYWSWLFALKSLVKEFGDGYPTFMQTKAWLDKELTTALASWAELRHDTILYAKQSYTMTETSMPLPEKPAVGYIEPIPEFFNRLLALTRMTTEGLKRMGVLDQTAENRLKSLENILARLVELSVIELENKELTQDDYDFIKNFGNFLSAVIEEVDEKAKKTSIIADVHTDGNTGQVLEEGVGYVKLIVVAYKVPDGRIILGAGPVMSYYEFKHPMSDRLTDEKWRDEILPVNPPDEPEWLSNFTD